METKEQEKSSNSIDGICKQIENLPSFTDNITSLDLSSNDLTVELIKQIKLPINSENLNLSKNKLQNVPKVVLACRKIKFLNLSSNQIEYFDDTPLFCHTIEELDISRNNLNGPPYWVWTENPKHLKKLNISNNVRLTTSLGNGYLEELLQYTAPVKEIDISHCNLTKYSLLESFCQATQVILGTEEVTSSRNFVETLPCDGLNKCREVEKLVLINCQIYSVEKEVDVFSHLVELNLMCNNISDLPQELCNLTKLKSVVLSHNELLYLPNNIINLIDLEYLHVDSNNLCTLPETISAMPKLKYLDLYNNKLNEVPDFENLEQLDVAQNYFDEPQDDIYKDKRNKLRLNILYPRLNGCKEVIESSESEHSSSDPSDDEICTTIHSDDEVETRKQLVESSEEDWDSDDYWVPHPVRPMVYLVNPWQGFVKRKMEEGNFCPMDWHTVPVMQRVRYEKMMNPVQQKVVYGQFDDLSDDDS